MNIDQARREHAKQRAASVVARYEQAHPDGLLAQKLRDRTVTSDEAYQLLKEFSHDPKTGVERPDLLHLTIEHELDGAATHGWPVSVIIVDLDDFKKINTELTHVGADDVLREVATILRDGVRDSDDVLTDDGTVVRWGGEEFVIVLVGASLTNAVHVAERLRATIAESFLGRRPNNHPVTASFGVATWTTPADGAWRDLLLQADTLLSAAKKAGKNCVRY